MNYICKLCKKKGVHREFDDFLDLEVHVLTEHYEEIDWNKVLDEWEKIWITDLAKLVTASKQVYDALKTIVHGLSGDFGRTDEAFISACSAVKAWEKMDHHISQMLNALQQDSLFSKVIEKLEKLSNE